MALAAARLADLRATAPAPAPGIWDSDGCGRRWKRCALRPNQRIVRQWRPAAAVRAPWWRARRGPPRDGRWPAWGWRKGGAWRRKISATSRAGAMTPAQPGGTTSKRSRSSGLGVLLIVLVATRV